jgi:hypothetical protein
VPTLAPSGISVRPGVDGVNSVDQPRCGGEMHRGTRRERARQECLLTSPAPCLQTLAMTTEPEALMAVVERLTERFSDQHRSVIEDVVAEEHGLLDGGPIRDFIPVLVERAAKIRLSRP